MGRWVGVTLILAFACAAQAFETGETVIVTQPVTDDFYGAGRRVELRAQASGDVVAAGQTVRIDAPVAQDVIAAGELVTIAAPVGDDVRAAGREVRIEQNISGHLLAAGAMIEVVRGTRIGSFAWLAGNEVVVAGDVAGPLRVAGESVRISGHITGDADISARRLELLAGARIDGNLTWRGEERQMADGATVGGTVIEKPAPAERHELGKAMVWAGAFAIAAFALASLVLYLLFPRAADRAAGTIRHVPWRDAALGFAFLILTPVVIVLLFITAIGWLLALLLLALYLAALPVGGMVGTYAVTDMALSRVRKAPAGRGLRALVLVLAVVLVGLLQAVPVLGGLLMFWLLLWGLGAILLLVYDGVGAGTATQAGAANAP